MKGKGKTKGRTEQTNIAILLVIEKKNITKKMV
jgi:hypothetical protein